MSHSEGGKMQTFILNTVRLPNGFCTHIPNHRNTSAFTTRNKVRHGPPAFHVLLHVCDQVNDQYIRYITLSSKLRSRLNDFFLIQKQAQLTLLSSYIMIKLVGRKTDYISCYLVAPAPRFCSQSAYKLVQAVTSSQLASISVIA